MIKRLLKVSVAILAVVAAAFVLAPHFLPSALSFHRSDIWFEVPTKQKQLFVTIDDAPSRSTGKILSVLKKHGVPATFFIVADRVKTPAQLEEIVGAKHALGNHLKTTRACSTLSLPEFQSDFDACEDC